MNKRLHILKTKQPKFDNLMMIYLNILWIQDIDISLITIMVIYVNTNNNLCSLVYYLYNKTNI